MNDFPGNCYSISLELIGTKKNSAKLVHGHIYSTKLNKMIRHAWIEEENKVYDFSGGKRTILPIKDYYHYGKATPVNTYTKEEALLMARKTGRAEWWSDNQIHAILGF